jgi:fucose 4-O-acetylase-like acetyltransferase
MNLKLDKSIELKNCIPIKAILAILVVLYHSTAFWGENWFAQNPIYESKVIAFFSSWLNSFHIYTFILVSGYIFYYVKYEKNEYTHFFDFIVKKFKRLIIPYVFICITWAAPFYSAFFTSSLAELIEKFLLGKSPSQLWFLLMLFNIFCISYFLSCLAKSHPFFSVIIMGVIWIVGYLMMFLNIPNFFQIESTFIYLPFFYVGFWIRQYGTELLKLTRIHSCVYLICMVLPFVAVTCIAHFVISGNRVCFWLKGSLILSNTLVSIFESIACFMLLQRSLILIKHRSKWFKFLMKNNMTIYLLHQQIIYVVIAFFNGKVNPFVNVGLNFCIAIVLSSIIAMFLSSWKITRSLIGQME